MHVVKDRSVLSIVSSVLTYSNYSIREQVWELVNSDRIDAIN